MGAPEYAQHSMITMTRDPYEIAPWSMECADRPVFEEQLETVQKCSPKPWKNGMASIVQCRSYKELRRNGLAEIALLYCSQHLFVSVPKLSC